MPLNSTWFRGSARLQQCLVSDPHHVLVGDRGPYVSLIQEALAILDGVPIDQREMTSASYGPSTAHAVKAYKTKRQIINRSYQTSVDDIVGKMTIQRLDNDMTAEEGKRFRLLFAVGITAQQPRAAVLSESADPWRKWARQFENADAGRRTVVVMPDGLTPKSAAATIVRAIGMTQGGVLILSVGHGGAGDARRGDEGNFDLAPAKAFRIGGRNSVLPGDAVPSASGPAETVHRTHTHVFYDERFPNAALKGGFQASRKDDDEKSGSDNAKTRLQNWSAYQEVCAAFKQASPAAVFLITCKVAGATGFLKRVAQQWNTPIIGYPRRVAAQEQKSGKARLFLEGDAPGGRTNVEWGETMIPLSLDMVQIRP